MAVALDGGTFVRAGEQRVFAYAVLASLLLHAVLLFINLEWRATVRKQDPAPGPLVARLAPARPVAAPPAAPAQPQEAPKPRAEEPPPPPPPPVARAVPKPVPTPLAKAAPAPAPAAESAKPAPAEAAAPAAPATAVTAPVAPAAPSAPGPAAKADTPVSTPAPSADAGTLDQYRIAIYSAAKKYKLYPRVALDNNWEGKVVIHMVIGANTMISSLSIKSSSGHEVLDRAAMDTLRKAKPLVPIPPALRGKEFGVDINFIFNLKDQNA